MGAIFFPLFYLGGDERSEMLLVISLLGAIGIFLGLTSFVNALFGPEQTAVQILISAVILLICSITAFLLSVPTTYHIFKRKDY